MHPNKGDTTANEKVAQSRWIFFNTPLKRLHKKATEKNKNTCVKDFIFISRTPFFPFLAIIKKGNGQ